MAKQVRGPKVANGGIWESSIWVDGTYIWHIAYGRSVNSNHCTF